tara:strand:- start:70 stop:1158 length:1089 start_codon:yes stop_codon:yes gene_type:complete
MKNKNLIAVLPGDGIGPEVMKEALKVLNFVNNHYHLNIETKVSEVGGQAIDLYGEALPDKTLELCQKSKAILFGSVGGSKWDKLPPEKRPERASLLFLRKHFNLFANLRPCKVLKDLSPLKEERIQNGVDLMCVRELTGGLYFGEKGKKFNKHGEKGAFDTLNYFEKEVQRIATLAFKLARKRKKKVTSIDKANVLTSMVLWRETVKKVSKNFEDVSLEHIYVDNMSMQLMLNPSPYDVLLCPNSFGDILSDQCAGLSGSLGLLPSASLGENNFGLYEPAGGTAPDLVGKNKANPLAQIHSLSLLLRYSFENDKAASLIEKAIDKVLEKGIRTRDLFTSKTQTLVGTKEMGDEVVKEMEKLC